MTWKMKILITMKKTMQPLMEWVYLKVEVEEAAVLVKEKGDGKTTNFMAEIKAMIILWIEIWGTLNLRYLIFKANQIQKLICNGKKRVEFIFDCHQFSDEKKVKFAMTQFSDYAID